MARGILAAMDFLQSLSEAFGDDAPSGQPGPEEHSSPSLSVPLLRGRAWLNGQLSRDAFEEDLELQIRQFEDCVRQLQEACQRSQDEQERNWLQRSEEICERIADVLDEYLGFQTLEQLEAVKSQLVPLFDRLIDLQRQLNQRAQQQQPPEYHAQEGFGSRIVSPDLYQLYQLLSQPEPRGALQHLETMLARYRQAAQLLRQQPKPLQEAAQGLLSSLGQLYISVDQEEIQSLHSDFENVVHHYEDFCRHRDAL